MEAEARFREIFDAAYPVVVRFARHRGLAGQDLEDCVAATFEVAWRRFDQVPLNEEAVPWLVGVARNQLRRHRRTLARDRGLIERLPAPDPVASWESAGTAISWGEVRSGLAGLSSADRELLLLVAWDGLSPTHAAQVLGIAPGAARTRLHRARGRLARALGWTDARTSQIDSRPAGSQRVQ